MLAIALTSSGVYWLIRMHHHHNIRARRQRLAVTRLLVSPVPIILVVKKNLQPSSLAIFIVSSLLWSSTKIVVSTTSGSSRNVFSSVFDALYAGITTTIHLPLIIVFCRAGLPCKFEPRGWDRTL